MSPTSVRRRRAPLALGVAVALALPWAAQAQTTDTGAASAREQQLEQRVDQLQQEVEQLKSMIQAQQQAAAQPAPAAPAIATQAVAAAPATSTGKPVFTTAPGLSVALHGFIDVSAFDQSKSFTYGNGQNAEYPVAGSNGSLSGMDVRNTRFWLDFSGAQLAGDWIGGGRIEMDFFGGYNGTGAYAQQQPIPRLRQAYMDLVNPDTGTTVRIGQQWDLLFPLDSVTTSLSHIAFPLGFGTGMIGWRYPGVVWMQDLNHGSGGIQWRLDLGAFEGSWNGPDGAVNNTNYLTAGNAGFRPQVEARLHVQGVDWLGYAVAHYSTVDLRGVSGTVATPVQSSVKSVGYEVGGQWKPGPWVFRANAYTGKGLGQVFGDLSQFGDIKDTGGYVQAGYNFTKNWNLSAIYATSKPNKDDVIRWMGNGATGLLRSRQTGMNLTYAAGSYELGIEWLYGWLDSTTNGIDTKTTSGNQLSLSALYHF
ncbi:hypothetical protein [Rhodanobacter sp. DHG33]|uniref:hypothetical protein n=1 Tax=Rhodanobacter sp. DHG33 TaxID=2775921 RepID=UPI001786173D|nr:hypothetical protein [Rhodanobacter sp. DHG33]MBD8898760.1 hypothetical protein [Rhodanobacter sp. DHG33]